MAETELVKRLRVVANEVWAIASAWQPFARDTIGKQVVRSADSIAANLIEGDGRYRDGDALHFFVIARGSLRETEYWLSVAGDRSLINADRADRLLTELDQLGRMLNAFINHRRQTKDVNAVREEVAPYGIDEPLHASRLAPHA